ncbi:endothelial PAS domain-containing protein 1 [Salarias fasciatus]|uniref:endothelial PAS domain-containing protein 1 n=1 Tax=Salarias fasciatus TaxID=181472 RepID=UPI001176F11A|nr:endothelial PAS domain-containing protein 1 [Salarias fasciatus]
MTADKDKRRAISREAARRRRKVESDKFEELSGLLPLPPSVRSHLDKPSIIRLTLSYMRIHTLLKENSGFIAQCRHRVKPQHAVKAGGNSDPEPRESQDLGLLDESSLYMRILEGFLMVLSSDGNMVFLSDNVNKYMGLTQTELMGHNIFEYAHPCDHEEIKHNLRVTAEGVCCGERRDFVVRMKSALTQRGRSATLKSATWKVLHCQGRVNVCVFRSSISCLLLTCRPLPLPHTLLNAHTFTSQHSMDMKFIYCDQSVTCLLGYSPQELLGRSVYDFCHTLDATCLQKSHFNLCWKTQSVSGQYRMLVKGGGYVWVESHSAVIPSKSRPAAHQPVLIFSITYVLSGVEEPLLQLSVDQTRPYSK